MAKPFAISTVLGGASPAVNAEANITVVAAVIEDVGRLLVTRRPEGGHLAGLWEFPGGKTAPHEGHAAALRREIREELDADVEVHELLHATTHDYPDRRISLFFYRCTMAGSPRPVLGQQMRWVAARDLDAREFPPADAELIRLLVDQAQSSDSSFSA